MTVTFELKTDPQALDTPLVNLRNKEFKRVSIDCIDGVTYVFVKDGDPREFISSTPVFGDKVISLFSEHLSFERLGGTWIIPYSSIVRWGVWEC